MSSIRLQLGFVFLFTAVAAYAQTTGLMQGTVVDPGDAPVPGAQVSCRNINTGVTQATVTNAEGIFRFPELPIGTYEITAAKQGFQRLLTNRVDLLTGHTVDLKLQLKIGAVSESVEVKAEAALIESATAEVQTTVDTRQMTELPLNGRNPLDLVVLTPGADFTATGTSPGQQDNTGVTVNGNRSTENNYQLDGASFTNNFYGSAPTLPNPDTLAEFSVQSADFSARESRAGALVLLSTRSGTNQWHGSAFDFFRNNKMDARNFFANTINPFKRNQTGGSLGGPIRHDRTFLFASYQGTFSRGAPSPKILTVPSAAQANGDFTAQANEIIVDPQNGQPFPGNIIPKSRFDPAAAKLLTVFPFPNGGANKAILPVNADVNDHQFVVKVDHHFSEKNNLTVRYYFDRNEFQRDTSSPPGIYALNDFRNHIVTVRDTHIVGPSLTTTTSFSFAQNLRNQFPVAPIFNRDLTNQIVDASSTPAHELRLNINNYFNFLSGGALQYNPKGWEIRSQTEWNHGTHLIAFGLDFYQDREFGTDTSVGTGTWTFDPTRTANSTIKGSVGDSFASFLLGTPLTFQETFYSNTRMTENRPQFWVQDDWKVRPGLTINLGLRWEPTFPPADQILPLPGFVPGLKSHVAPNAPTGLVFSGDVRNPIFPNHWKDVGPRVGAAWDISGSGKMVVRAGYGIYYHEVPGAVPRSAALASTFRGLSVTVNNPLSFTNPWGSYPGGNPFPYHAPSLTDLQTYKFPNPVTTGALDPFARTGYTQAWNFAIERQVRSDTSLKLSYVGNHSLGILGAREGNPAIFGPGATSGNIDSRRIYAGLASVTLITPFQWGNYNALQATVIKRAGRGLSVLANYTWAKALDAGTNGGLGQATGAPRNPFNAALDKGPADFDVRHRGNIALLYDLPKVTQNSLAGVLVNGWQFNTIVTLQTGYAFTPTSGQRALVGGNTDFGDLVGNPTRPSGADAVLQWFNTAAFVLPSLGGFGTAGRNILRGPDKEVVNFSTFKNFRPLERLTLQFRFEAFNFLNHANFNLPNAQIGSLTNSQVLGAADPRVLQLAFKVVF